MRINQKRSYKKLIIGASVGVVVIAGIAFYMFDGLDKVRAAFQPKNQEQTIEVTGKLVCLPRKDGGEVSALSCALGVQTDQNKYYGLSGSQNTELSEAAGTSKTVKLSGELRSSSDNTYKADGIIAVSHFDFTD